MSRKLLASAGTVMAFSALALAGCSSRTHSTITPAGETTMALDLSNCQDQGFFNAHPEFCAGGSAKNPTSTPTPTAPTFAHVGDVVHFDGGNTTGTITLNSAKRAPDGANLLIDVTATVTEVRDGTPLLVSEMDFTAQDPKGIVYHSTYTPGNTTLSTKVSAGRQVRGVIAFPIPKGQALIDWAPGLGDPAATWDVTA